MNSSSRTPVLFASTSQTVSLHQPGLELIDTTPKYSLPAFSDQSYPHTKMQDLADSEYLDTSQNDPQSIFPDQSDRDTKMQDPADSEHLDTSQDDPKSKPPD